MAEFWSNLGKLWKSARARIVVWAALTGLLIGVTGFAEPAEDALRNLRFWAQEKRASGDIVVVTIDNHTLEGLGAIDVNHGNDAGVLASLFKAGASRVFFDRPFAVPGSKEQDGKFVDALKAHPGQVFLGAIPGGKGEAGNYASRLPLEKYREHAGVVSLLIYHAPFNLNIGMPLASDSPIGKIPSLSAGISGVDGSTDRLYFPDNSIRVRTFPALSYVDVLRGQFKSSVGDNS
ncbi:MAG: CHASE2 domain-containing protein, partial [Novosphingobium sp.]